MLGSQLPKWRQIIGTVKYNSESFWGQQELVWTSKTAISFRLIIEAYKQIKNVESITICIPDYFCGDTLYMAIPKQCKILFYPINDEFEPEWKTIRSIYKDSKIDFFIFTHYFGICRDINKAVDFCKHNDIVLLEDCAHCLYSYEKIGQKGDLSFFSPHKILPVYSGGIINCNRQEGIAKEIYDFVKNQVEKEIPSQDRNVLFWRLKKAIQKITKLKKDNQFVCRPHYIASFEFNYNYPVTVDFWSKKILMSYTYTDLKRVSFLRKQNLMCMNYIVTKLLPDIKVIIKDAFCPYFAVYSLENIEIKDDAVRILQRAGLLVMYWPDLPRTLESDAAWNNRSRVENFSKNLIFVPVHQGLDIQCILHSSLKGKADSESGGSKYCFKPITEENRNNLDSYEFFRDNIPQDDIYGNAKTQSGGGRCKNLLIFDKDKCIGKIQILIEKKFGLKFAYRINRGPLLIKGYENSHIVFEVMKSLRKEIGISPVFWAPNLDFNPENMWLSSINGWKQWRKYGYCSGTIDLSQDEDELRNSLSSKWRNQLVSAEKKNLTVFKDNNRYKEILKIYLAEQKEKRFKGVPDLILKKLYHLEQSPLNTYYVTDDKNNIIAFDIVYVQRKTVHYLVGWNSEDGRKIYLNNLLLYYITVDSKKQGLESFDLGGIEYLDTEAIAKFKDGMNPIKYRLMGEFIKL